MAPSTGERLRLSRLALSIAGNASVVVFAGNLLARGLGFLFPVLLARVLDRADFALGIFFINTGFFVSELVLTGFPTALTRAVAGTSDPGRRWLALWGSVVGGIPLLVSSIAIGIVLATSVDASPFLLGVVVVGLTVDAYYFGVLRGLQRFGLVAVYRISANLAQLVMLLAAAALGIASLPVAVLIYAGTYLVPIAAIEARSGPVRKLLTAGAAADRAAIGREVASLARFAIPALISGTAYGAVMGLDVFFVRLFAPGHLADYGAARSLALPMLLVPFSISVVLLPRAAAASPSERLRLLARAMAVVGAAAVVAWLGWLVAGPTVIGLLFPPSYAAAAEPLGALIPALGVVGIYSVLSQWTLGIGRPWPAAACLSLGAVVSVVAHLALTARIGPPGAAASIGLGAGTALVLLGGYTVRTRGRPDRKPAR